MDTSVTDHLLSTTRAVRRRLDLDRPVERQVVLDCLRLAVQAPTGGNRQTWRWMVVTDETKRAELARLYNVGAQEYFRLSASEVQDPQTVRVRQSAIHLAEVLHRVPVHVIACVEGRLEGESNQYRAGPAFWGSIIPAGWSFQLALRSRGLGSAWTTLHLAQEAEVAELLAIPPDVTQVALFPVAYTVGDDFKPARRPPVEEITYWDTWGRTGL